MKCIGFIVYNVFIFDDDGWFWIWVVGEWLWFGLVLCDVYFGYVGLGWWLVRLLCKWVEW